MSRESFNKPNLKWDLNRINMRVLCTIREICDLALYTVRRLRLQLFMSSLFTILNCLNFHSFSITHCIALHYLTVLINDKFSVILFI